MQTQQTILSLPLSSLLPHPANPNRLSEAAFAKLLRHIGRTGQYEPLVVRRHPQTPGAYQILNGRHRARALKQLGYSHADCVVFEADDNAALVYLISLNRLSGRDNLYKKSKLIEMLCRRFSSRQLAGLLPDSRTAIDKLAGLSASQPAPKTSTLLMPMTFFVDPDQHALLLRAFEKARADVPSGTATQKRLQALLHIVGRFVETSPTQPAAQRASAAAGGTEAHSAGITP
ncbi:MAG: ParB-like nuclease domain-containing protein [Phycisphaerae bacterium]|nr:ParB-like nuclease domain-containing protein [Phycisphaerae bacterium]